MKPGVAVAAVFAASSVGHLLLKTNFGKSIDARIRRVSDAVLEFPVIGFIFRTPVLRSFAGVFVVITFIVLVFWILMIVLK